MSADRFGEHSVLDGDVVGVGDLDCLVESIADGHVIHDGVAGVAQSQSVVTGEGRGRPDTDVLQDPVFGEIIWCAHILVLIRSLVGDQTPDGDTAR